MATEKQKMARNRNYFLFRMMGFSINVDMKFLTQEEKDLYCTMQSCREEIISKFDQNSEAMGLKVNKKRHDSLFN